VTSPREQLRAGAEAFFKLLEEHQGRWLLLFGSNAVLPGEFNTELANLRFSTIEQIHVLIRAATPGGPPARIEAAAHAASGVGERLGHWWIAHPEITREDLVEHFVELVWNGVSPYVPPGEPSSPQP
jgi:hypothetical protein